MDLLSIGDVSVDLYMKIDENDGLPTESGEEGSKICFRHGSKIPVEHFETSVAGNSLNVGVGCSLLGLKTGIYSELGDDANGQKILLELRERKIDIELCHINKGQPTNVHTIIVYGGDRTIFSYHERYTYGIKKWPKTKWVYYTSLGYGFEKFHPGLIDFKKKNPGVGLAFNPGTIQIKAGLNSFKDVMEYTDVFFCNKEEAQMLIGDGDLPELHKGIHKLGAKLSVITDGENGASAYDRHELVQVGVFKDLRPIVDKTGAGDSFSSGFISALFYGKNLKEALGWGAINASSNIRIVGAITGLCDKNEIEKMYEKGIE